jgi:hypothetical protein
LNPATGGSHVSGGRCVYNLHARQCAAITNDGAFPKGIVRMARYNIPDIETNFNGAIRRLENLMDIPLDKQQWKGADNLLQEHHGLTEVRDKRLLGATRKAMAAEMAWVGHSHIGE